MDIYYSVIQLVGLMNFDRKSLLDIHYSVMQLARSKFLKTGRVSQKKLLRAIVNGGRCNNFFTILCFLAFPRSVSPFLCNGARVFFLFILAIWGETSDM